MPPALTPCNTPHSRHCSHCTVCTLNLPGQTRHSSRPPATRAPGSCAAGIARRCACCPADPPAGAWHAMGSRGEGAGGASGSKGGGGSCLPSRRRDEYDRLLRGQLLHWVGIHRHDPGWNAEDARLALAAFGHILQGSRGGANAWGGARCARGCGAACTPCCPRALEHRCGAWRIVWHCNPRAPERFRSASRTRSSAAWRAAVPTMTSCEHWDAKSDGKAAGPATLGAGCGGQSSRPARASLHPRHISRSTPQRSQQQCSQHSLRKHVTALSKASRFFLSAGRRCRLRASPAPPPAPRQRWGGRAGPAAGCRT